MKLECAPFQQQSPQWPQTGKVILAQFDSATVVIYQAYRASVARYATSHGCLGGPDFSYTRMSWIKPNFLWMMYRSGWGTKESQEHIVAIRIARTRFDNLLRLAVHSTFQPSLFASQEDWKQAVANSDVRLQWDPDHDPAGRALDRRAIQLGLRGSVLKQFGQEWIVDIEDVSSFVSQQKAFAATSGFDELQTPIETVYPVSDPLVVKRLGLDHF